MGSGRKQLVQFLWPAGPPSGAIVEGTLPSSTETARFLRAPVALLLHQPMAWRDWGPVNESIFDERPPLLPRIRYYEPLGVDALFKRFADTPCTPEGVLIFAKKFGHLGIQEPFVRLSPKARDWGELLERWYFEILSMREAVSAWKAVGDEDRPYLRDRIVWEEAPSNEGPVIWYECQFALTEKQWALLHEDPRYSGYGAFDGRDGRFRQSIAGGWDLDGLYVQIREGDLIEAGRAYVQRAINRRLGTSSGSQLLWSPETRRHTVRVVPNSLLGALWLQFGFSIQGNFRFTECAHCGAWFELAPQAHRKQVAYCSDSCKYKAYRVRRKAVQAPRQTRTRSRKSGRRTARTRRP